MEAERTARTWHDQLLALTPFAPLLAKHVARTADEPNELWSRLGAELKKPRTLDELHQALGRALELIDDDTGSKAPARGATTDRETSELKRALKHASTPATRSYAGSSGWVSAAASSLTG